MILVALVAFAAGPPAFAAADPAAYVRPLSGTLGSGFPMVGASVPFGLIQPGPDTGLADGSEDPVNYCGYAFQDPDISGFSLTHFDGAGIMIAGDLPFMPTTGAPSFDSKQNASPFDHATEVAQPGYYAVTLDRDQTRVELTSALRASMARITFPQTSQANNVQANISNEAHGPPTANASTTGNAMVMLAVAPSNDQLLAIMHERHEGMETIGKTNKAIYRELGGGSPDLGTVRSGAAKIADLSRKASGWFPKGSGPELGCTPSRSAAHRGHACAPSTRTSTASS